MTNGLKYFRRVFHPKNQVFSLWHEVSEVTAIQSVKLGVPKEYWFKISEWFDEGIPLGNAFAGYRKATYAFIRKINGDMKCRP